MPIYEYVCDECGERFEVFQRSRNTPEAPHSECGGTGRRVMSQTSFALKGSGWYRDHYGLKSSASTDSSSGGSSGGSAKTSTSSSSASSSGDAGAGQGGGGSEKSGSSSDTKAAGKKSAA